MKVFIAGPRAISSLDENIQKKINSICNKNYEILLGDANGIDSSVQQYLSILKYSKVKVYSSNGIVRNNYGNWQVENVQVDSSIKGFDFYVQKDLEMVKDADIGLMIWNGESKGTLNDIINLLKLNKSVVMYFVNNRKFYLFERKEQFDEFLRINVKLTSKLRQILNTNSKSKTEQICLF